MNVGLPVPQVEDTVSYPRLKSWAFPRRFRPTLRLPSLARLPLTVHGMAGGSELLLRPAYRSRPVDCPADLILCGLTLKPNLGTQRPETCVRVHRSTVQGFAACREATGAGLLVARTGPDLCEANTTMRDGTNAIASCDSSRNRVPGHRRRLVGEAYAFLPRLKSGGSCCYPLTSPTTEVMEFC